LAEGTIKGRQGVINRFVVEKSSAYQKIYKSRNTSGKDGK
jgi:hypothetical protein